MSRWAVWNMGAVPKKKTRFNAPYRPLLNVKVQPLAPPPKIRNGPHGNVESGSETDSEDEPADDTGGEPGPEADPAEYSATSEL